MKKPFLQHVFPAVTAALTIVTTGVAGAQTLVVPPDPMVKKYTVPTSAEPTLSRAQLVAALQAKVKYVFVLYQENRSFDSYFGTFPGADGLYSQPPAQTPGYYQKIYNTDGSAALIHPFRIDPVSPYYSADTDDIDHSHPRIVAKMDVTNYLPHMDMFALTEEYKYTAPPTTSGVPYLPTLKAKQFGELSMAYEDGDTVPFLWQYANRFTLFDHIFQEMTGPSTPGNLSIIGAQAGATQAMLHPDQAFTGTGSSGAGVPVLNDTNPLWGSIGETSSGQPANPTDGTTSQNAQKNLTYATLPLTLSGKALGQLSKPTTPATGIVAGDKDQAGDLGDVADDVPFITGSGKSSVPWGWYEEGYDKEPTDPADPVDAMGTHASYITHHNGPQYFGYISNNPNMSKNLHGLQDFYSTIKGGGLPASGGLFYVKGGYENLLSLKPADPATTVQASFLGDDDHPAYSDAQISEAQIANIVNMIAGSSYWNQCAIIITWDDSEGDYDHVQPTLRNLGVSSTGVPTLMSDGPRVPLLILSPYSKTGTIVHDIGDHASVVKFADVLFNLTPLADLPDELEARQIGENAGLANQGPLDDLAVDVADLTSAFDPARLTGVAMPLPASYAEIPSSVVLSVPPVIVQNGKTVPYGLQQIGVMPTDYKLGIKNQIPSDFNPRPNTVPGVLGSPIVTVTGVSP